MNDETIKQESTPEQETAQSCGDCEKYLAGWKRALADYDNLKKELAREKIAIRESVCETLAHDLIQTLDHFDQALKHKPGSVSSEVAKWLTGILHVRSQLEGVLKSLGLAPFGQPGEMFDSALHESIGVKTQEDSADNQILEVISRGWRMGERIVRPAKVIINELS